MTQTAHFDTPFDRHFPSPIEIPRIDRLSVDDFVHAFQRPGRPVVITGVMDDWPALQWSAQSLADHCAHQRVVAVQLTGGRAMLDPNRAHLARELTFGQFIDHIREVQPPQHYLKLPFERLPLALQAEVPTPAHCGAALGLKRNLFVGGAGTIGPAHQDLPRNLYAQLSGRKRWILHAPSQSALLYRHSWTTALVQLSQVDLEEPDLARFPRFGLSEPHVAVLEPGELLYVPPLWWHYTRALDLCIAVNFWWSSLATWPVALASEGYKRLRRMVH